MVVNGDYLCLGGRRGEAHGCQCSKPTTFEVGDYDFSAFSLIPSVCFLVVIW